MCSGRFHVGDGLYEWQRRSTVVGLHPRAKEPLIKKTRGQSPRFFKEPTAISQYSQIHIWIILGKIGFKWFSAHAEGFLKAVGRKPSGEGSSVVFHARTLRKPLDI
jgi:hypothetical protein